MASSGAGDSGVTDPLVSDTPANELVEALSVAGQTIATAESLTAGLLAATIAGVPGASAVLRGGLIVYVADLKVSLAQVDPRVIDTDGAVSAAAAAQLATGARQQCAADWGVGLTGVAGPDSQDGWPVGTVFLGVAGPAGVTVRQLALPGGRWAVRQGAVRAAIAGVIGQLPRG